MEVIDIIILFGFIFLFYCFLQIVLEYRSSLKYQPLEQKQPEIFNLTLEQLTNYDGIINKQTFFAIKDAIFDVSGSDFYGPDGSYRIFVGKDISVALAKNSFEEKFFNQYNKQELSPQEKKNLNDWYEKLSAKYQIVGQIIDKKKQ